MKLVGKNLLPVVNVAAVFFALRIEAGEASPRSSMPDISGTTGSDLASLASLERGWLRMTTISVLMQLARSLTRKSEMKPSYSLFRYERRKRCLTFLRVLGFTSCFCLRKEACGCEKPLLLLLRGVVRFWALRDLKEGVSDEVSISIIF